MADTTAKLNILVQLKDEASSAMRSISNSLSDVGGNLGFAADKGGILAGAFAALGATVISGAITAFEDANYKLLQAQAILKTMPDGMKLYQQAIEEGNKAQAQFGFDNEQITLSLAKFLRATGGDMPHALQALQAAMGTAINKFGGPDGMEEATNAVMRAFAGGGRMLKDFGEKIGDNESAMSAIAKVAQYTAPILDAWGQSSKKNTAIVGQFGEEIKEGMGKPLTEAKDKLLQMITGSDMWQKAIQALDPFIQGLGVSITAVTGYLAIRAIPTLVQTVAGFLGVAGAAEITGAAIAGFTLTVGLWVVAIAAVIAIGILVIKNWDEIKTQLIAAWELIKMKAEELWGGIVNFFKTLPETIGQIFGELVVGVVKWMQGLYDFFTQTIPLTIKQIVDWFANLPNMVVNALSSLPARAVAIFNNAASSIKSVFQDVINFIANAPGSIVDFGKNAINSFIDVVNKFVKGFNSVAGKVNITIPELPKFANGGIVTQPTLGLIGEAGPEAIIPLNRLQGRGIGGGGGITINIQGDVYSTREVAEKFANEIARLINYQIKLA